MSVLERIEKLIALAGSESEHEARSAAYLACKLIRDHGYRVVDGEPEPAFDPFEAFRRAAWEPPPPRRPAPRRPPPDLRPRREVPTSIARARRPGVCVVCREDIEEGSDIAVPTLPADGALGVVHADCRARWAVPVET